MGQKLLPKSWFINLHRQSSEGFNTFVKVYNLYSKYQFNPIVNRDDLAVIDASHLFLLASYFKPRIIVETGSANGLTTSLISTALLINNCDFKIYSFEEHPGPRKAAIRRAKELSYSDHVEILPYEALNQFKGSIDFFCLLDRRKEILKPFSFKSSSRVVNYFLGQPSKKHNLCYSDPSSYMFPGGLNQNKKLIIGGWCEILQYWNYELFTRRLFEWPISRALIKGEV